nr:MAG TPA: hypothetical protein [Caudoviricetes sp.]
MPPFVILVLLFRIRSETVDYVWFRIYKIFNK